MDQAIKGKVSCYSDGEQGLMDMTRKWRAWALDPVLRVLAGLKIRADHITLAGLLAGVFFFPLFFANKIAAFGALLAHCLLDGIDGPLARFTGKDSEKGAFTDTATDQTVIAVSTFAMIKAQYISALGGGLYVFFYTVLVAFAMVRGKLNIPYPWLIRPRFFVYAWLLVEVFWLPGTISWLIWGSVGLMMYLSLKGFMRIREKL